MSTILIENWHRHWASLSYHSLRRLCALVFRRRRCHRLNHRRAFMVIFHSADYFVVFGAFVLLRPVSPSVVPRRPQCRNLRGNSISNSKWMAFTCVGISILSLLRSRGTNALHSVVPNRQYLPNRE